MVLGVNLRKGYACVIMMRSSCFEFFKVQTHGEFWRHRRGIGMQINYRLRTVAASTARGRIFR